MAITDDQIAFVMELFEGLGDLSYRKMFGGLSLYHHGQIFGIVMSDGHVYLKGEGAFRTRVEAEGWTPWAYETKSGKQARMPYWQLPEAALDEPDDAVTLARAALDDL